MDKGLQFRNKSSETAKMPKPLPIPAISGRYRPQSRPLDSPNNTQGDSSLAFHSFNSTPQSAQQRMLKRSSSNPEKKDIFKDMKEIFKTCRVQKNMRNKNEHLKMSRDEKQALYLPKDLHSFCKDHKLREKKVQLKYANTLKKIKEKGKQMSCQIRAKSQGIEFQLRKETQQKQKDLFGYTFTKGMGRFLKKKMVKQVNKCKADVVSMKVTAANHCQKMTDALKKNERDEVYKGYNCERIDKFMKSKATEKKQYPYYIKTQLDSTFAAIKKKQMSRSNSMESDDELVSLDCYSPTIKRKQTEKSQKQLPIEKTLQGINSARMTTSSKKTISDKYKQFEEDIEQFYEIIEFFQRVQHQLFKFLPNNHLANKIDIMVNQVEHNDMVTKIYHKANTSIKYFRPDRIVAILKSCPGILGTMNYIVNVIKLNISAERRKRVIDQEKKVRDYQVIIKDANRKICQKLKKTSDQDLKKDIWNTLQKSQYQCLALNQAYSDFSKHNDEQDLSQLHTKGNRNYICQILQYETLLK